MEILVAAFLGAWLTTASILAFLRLKKEFKPIIQKESKK